MNVVENVFCYVLHSKPFKDTSAIVELLTRDYGRVSVLYKGVRTSKNSAKSRLLQPFQLLLASWGGKRELKNGRHVEQAGAAFPFSGRTLYSGIYLNEILMRVLHRDAPAEGIFECYQQCLSDLQEAENIEVSLRRFEYSLLDAIGYRLPCEVDAQNGAPIVADAYYRYEPDYGFVFEASSQYRDFPNSVAMKKLGVFKGELLLAIAHDSFSREGLSDHLLKDAKRLMRLALAPHIGGKPLESKKLFMGMSKYESSQ